MKNGVFWDIKPRSYLAGDTFHLRYKAQSVNAIYSYEVFTTVTMKNAVFWNIKPDFEPHRKHITSPLQSPAG
jgi:hypothetical protein